MGVQTALLLAEMAADVVGEAIQPTKLFDAVNVILSLQVFYCFILHYIYASSFG